MDGYLAKFVKVSTIVPAYAWAHAEYTGRSNWLGRDERTVVPSDESVVEPSWCRCPRTDSSLVRLSEAPICRPDERRLRMVAH